MRRFPEVTAAEVDRVEVAPGTGARGGLVPHIGGNPRPDRVHSNPTRWLVGLRPGPARPATWRRHSRRGTASVPARWLPGAGEAAFLHVPSGYTRGRPIARASQQPRSPLTGFLSPRDQHVATATRDEKRTAADGSELRRRFRGAGGGPLGRGFSRCWSGWFLSGQ